MRKILQETTKVIPEDGFAIYCIDTDSITDYEGKTLVFSFEEDAEIAKENLEKQFESKFSVVPVDIKAYITEKSYK